MTHDIDNQPGKYSAANGLNIHYKEYGEGYPLILLHGGTANLESWAEQVPVYAQHFRVIAVDSRGHGKTENPSGEMSYRLMADDVAAFIQALKLEKPFILGYSDGGQIALDLGMRYPDLSGGLILGGTLYKFKDVYFSFLKEIGIKASGVVDFEQMEKSDQGWIEYLKDAHPRENAPDYWKSLMQQISVMWWTPLGYTEIDLEKISAPTLILVGDRDDGIDLEQIFEMYRHIPNAELAIIPAADHGSAMRDLFNDNVLDFLLRHNAR